MSSILLESQMRAFLAQTQNSENCGTHITYGKKLEIFYNYLNEEKNITDENYTKVINQLYIEDIIESIEYYKANRAIKYRSTVENYLSVLHVFFAYMLEKYGIRNEYFEEKSKEKELRSRCEEYTLRNFEEKEPSEEIDDIKASMLISQCDAAISVGENTDIQTLRIENGVFTLYVSAIITKLVLLVALKNQRIVDKKLSDYDDELNEILIGKYRVNLPSRLAKQMRKYKELRAKILVGKEDRKLLFISVRGGKLSYASAFSILEDVQGDKKSTSVAKYSIIKMLRNGMPLSFVKQITGYQDDVCDYCLERVDEESEEFLPNKKNRQINVFLRGIDTYDML